MLAMPRACSLLGVWLGSCLLLAVGALTWLTVSRGILRSYEDVLEQRKKVTTCCDM